MEFRFFEDSNVSKPIGVGIVLIVGCCLSGILIVLISHAREKASQLKCRNQLRELALAASHYHDTHGHYPSATQSHPSLPPEKRLSWLVDMLPYLGVGGGEDATWPDLDRTKAWDDPRNFPLNGRDRKGPVEDFQAYYGFFCCTATPSRPRKLFNSQTTYLGLTGLGKDAAELPFIDPHAGFFGYERKIRSADITDGLSTTFMLAESGEDSGHWFQGGYPTARGLVPDSEPYVGERGQFSSRHRYRSFSLSLGSWGGSNFAFADGSARFITEGVSPKMLEAAVTIHGGETMTVFGEE